MNSVKLQDSNTFLFTHVAITNFVYNLQEKYALR